MEDIIFSLSVNDEVFSKYTLNKLARLSKLFNRYFQQSVTRLENERVLSKK